MERSVLCGIVPKGHIEVDQQAAMLAHSRAEHAAGEVHGCAR